VVLETKEVLSTRQHLEGLVKNSRSTDLIKAWVVSLFCLGRQAAYISNIIDLADKAFGMEGVNLDMMLEYNCIMHLAFIATRCDKQF
jgi:hypothetical protein